MHLFVRADHVRQITSACTGSRAHAEVRCVERAVTEDCSDSIPALVGTISIVLGIIAFFAGIVVWNIVRYQLSEQHITVSSDAPFLEGKDVKGPFTAFAQAAAINEHTLESGGGKTYAELHGTIRPRHGHGRAFLQASLYTSVVAFGVAFLVSVLGVVVVLIGLTLHELDRRTKQGEATESAPVEPSPVHRDARPVELVSRSAGPSSRTRSSPERGRRGRARASAAGAVGNDRLERPDPDARVGVDVAGEPPLVRAAGPREAGGHDAAGRAVTAVGHDVDVECEGFARTTRTQARRSATTITGWHAWASAS